jgi:signal transduction histidine kinase
VILNNEIVQLSLRCSVFRIEKKLYRVFSFQDIKSEIEKNEAEAWQKLIRIITHEITNSVSPITLTSSGIIQMLERNGKPLDAREIDNALLKSVLTGMHAIRKRSKGLASFVENYHTIYRLPQPALTTVPLNDLFKHIEALMASEFMNKKASLNTTVAPISLVLTADEKMITQVIINLLQNALQALEEAPDRRISLSAWQINDQVRISVTDHGKGIPPEMLDTVFVPFYTSRSEGSGIGLSLSREIMKLHGGGIRVYSDPGKETTFTLIF